MEKKLKEFKEYTVKVLDNYQAKLHMVNYNIDLEYIALDSTNDIATIDDDTVYLMAKIKLYPKIYKEFREGNLKYVKKIILHELCHIFTDRLSYLIDTVTIEGEYVTSKQFTDELETTTQKLTNVLADIEGFLEIN